MLRGFISSKGKTAPSATGAMLNKEVYTKILQGYMLAFTSGKFCIRKNDFFFMQGNESVHTAFHCKKWFKEKKIKGLSEPVPLPDLNPVENILGGVCKRSLCKWGAVQICCTADGGCTLELGRFKHRADSALHSFYAEALYGSHQSRLCKDSVLVTTIVDTDCAEVIEGIFTLQINSAFSSLVDCFTKLGVIQRKDCRSYTTGTDCTRKPSDM